VVRVVCRCDNDVTKLSMTVRNSAECLKLEFPAAQSFILSDCLIENKIIRILVTYFTVQVTFVVVVAIVVVKLLFFNCALGH